MSTQRYSVTPHPIETLLTWVKSGEIAIPEIQRPFVWDATKVRNLLDSLYQGYPVGYLIAWRNPTIRLKDGTLSAGKRILIDGQQRVTALMASMLGREVLTKDYETIRIRIAFHPVEKKFEVANPAIDKDPAWIPDIAELFGPNTRLLHTVRAYMKANKSVDEDVVAESLQSLSKITSNMVGIIELAEDLDIETVTEIFIRVNSAGATLSQADFAMSKIAANETYGGNQLRKAIDYFCRLAVAPDWHATIKSSDKEFAKSDYFQKMLWLKNANDDIYDPAYVDMLRVAFSSEFKRGKLQDLVALLSGRNFETKQYEERIAEESFRKLRDGVMNFMNQAHFERLLIAVRSAGFVHRDLIGGQNPLNVAYMLYLAGRSQKVSDATLSRVVARWFVFSMLTGRYSGSAETTIDLDIRGIDKQGLAEYTSSVMNATLTDSYWSTLLPQQMETSAVNSPYFLVYQAAQVKLKDRGFLSRDATVQDLVELRSNVHHIFPRKFLKDQGLSRGRYNQIANFALTQDTVNIQIGDKAPADYFAQLKKQCSGGKLKFGAIDEWDALEENLAEHCVPLEIFDGLAHDYDAFLAERRKLMAGRIKKYFAKL